LKESPEYPTQEIAGLTPFQQSIQQYLQSSSLQGQQDYQLAASQMRDTLNGGYDPMTSAYFQGYRQLAEEQKANSANTVRQRSQMAGMLNSTPSIGMETASNRQYDSMILQQLGQLYENERSNQLQAAQALPQMQNQNIGNLAAASGLGEAERQITQQRNDAAYNQALSQMLFPYTVQANIANALTRSNWGATIYGENTTTNSPSAWSNIASVASAGTGIFGGIANMNAASAQANYYNQMAGFWGGN
jgi:hypothetical protein